MAWESLLKVRPFLSDEQVKIANALTIAGTTNEPVDLSEYDTPLGKKASLG